MMNITANAQIEKAKSKKGPRVPLAASLLALFAAQPSQAQAEGWLDTLKGLHPYAAVSATSDSNLFRKPPGPFVESDRYATVEAGLDAEFKLSRQRLLMNGRVFHISYDRNQDLDYTGGDATVLWKWLLGDSWDGDIGYTFTRKQRGFANTATRQKDLQDRQTAYGSVNRWLATNWRLGMRANWTDNSFSDSAFLDTTRHGAGGALDYFTKAGNTLGFDVAYSTTQYQNQDDLDYDDVTLGGSARWQLTEKTRLRANAGYKTRTYDSAAVRNFEGPVGRIVLIWKATEKTTIEANLWHDVTTLADEVPNSAVVDAVSLEAQWQMTTKTALRALASFERRDFQRVEVNTIELPDRVDDVSLLSLWLDWKPRPTIALAVGFQLESRDSTEPEWDYDDQMFQVRVSIGL